MKIETKYNLWDMVWYIDGGKAKRDQITGIYIDVNDSVTNGIWIRYTLSGSNYSEHEVYPFKEELLKSL